MMKRRISGINYQNNTRLRQPYTRQPIGKQDARTRLLIVLSDGRRPTDYGDARYAREDTRSFRQAGTKA